MSYGYHWNHLYLQVSTFCISNERKFICHMSRSTVDANLCNPWNEMDIYWYPTEFVWHSTRMYKLFQSNLSFWKTSVDIWSIEWVDVNVKNGTFIFSHFVWKGYTHTQYIFLDILWHFHNNFYRILMSLSVSTHRVLVTQSYICMHSTTNRVK